MAVKIKLYYSPYVVNHRCTYGDPKRFAVLVRWERCAYWAMMELPPVVIRTSRARLVRLSYVPWRRSFGDWYRDWGILTGITRFVAAGTL